MMRRRGSKREGGGGGLLVSKVKTKKISTVARTLHVEAGGSTRTWFRLGLTVGGQLQSVGLFIKNNLKNSTQKPQAQASSLSTIASPAYLIIYLKQHLR